jgi:hypothetical protein
MVPALPANSAETVAAGTAEEAVATAEAVAAIDAENPGKISANVI